MSEQTTVIIRSKIPDLLSEKNMSRKQFAAYCMLKGISQTTGYKMADGATDISIPSLAAAASILKVDMGSLMVIES